MSEPAPTLADLRKEIDAIDAEMHAALMRRGRVIDRLIEIKKGQGGGSAFRPLREAQMMRAIAERHRGVLPLDTVEGIWRIIISTFTYVQAPHAAHVDVARGDAPMRDSARFHFGFTVPCVPHLGVAGVIEAVSASVGDLGLLAVDAGPQAGPWWRALEGADAPKIIARLPFVERPDHPAGLPVFVIARPLADGAAREEIIESVMLDRWRDAYPAALRALGAEILGNAGVNSGLALLVAHPEGSTQDDVRKALEGAGAADVRVAEIGAHARRFDGSGLNPRA